VHYLRERDLYSFSAPPRSSFFLPATPRLAPTQWKSKEGDIEMGKDKLPIDWRHEGVIWRGEGRAQHNPGMGRCGTSLGENEMNDMFVSPFVT
jgi:hypothetical protein